MVRGIKYFQNHYGERNEELERKFGIKYISWDSLKDPLPFEEKSQNIALQKTFGDTVNHQTEYDNIWEAMIKTLKPNSLIITTDLLPEKHANSVTKILDSLDGFNGMQLNWIDVGIGSYKPNKFDFYRTK